MELFTPQERAAVLARIARDPRIPLEKRREYAKAFAGEAAYLEPQDWTLLHRIFTEEGDR